MNWKDKIKRGMELIKEGCEEGTKCYQCPFDEYCIILEDKDNAPDNWETEE